MNRKRREQLANKISDKEGKLQKQKNGNRLQEQIDVLNEKIDVVIEALNLDIKMKK